MFGDEFEWQPEGSEGDGCFPERMKLTLKNPVYGHATLRHSAVTCSCSHIHF
jgi:hypothetical protein